MGRFDHSKKHYGVYTNSRGEIKKAYMEWKDDKDGYVLRDAENDAYLYGSAFESLKLMKSSGVDFVANRKIKATKMAANDPIEEKAEELQTVA